MNNLFKISIFLLLAIFTLACSNAQQKKEGVVNISADELIKLQAAGVKVVDVRTIGEVRQGKIPGAAHIEIGNDLATKMASYAMDEPVVIYCESGGRSAKAGELLKDAGFKLIYNYNGGMSDWRKSGKAVE